MPWSRGIVYGREKEADRNAEIWQDIRKRQNNSTPKEKSCIIRRAIVSAFRIVQPNFCISINLFLTPIHNTSRPWHKFYLNDSEKPENSRNEQVLARQSPSNYLFEFFSLLFLLRQRELVSFSLRTCKCNGGRENAESKAAKSDLFVL